MKLLTLDDLDNRNNKQLKYFKTKLEGSSTPKSLFNDDGTFNNSNWNSGEANYIRNIIDNLVYTDDRTIVKEFDVDYWDVSLFVSGTVFISYYWHDDYNYLSILVDGEYSGDNDYSSYFTDQYVIRVYKNKGKTELIHKNGKPITRNEYLSLLHILQSIGLIKEGK